MQITNCKINHLNNPLGFQYGKPDFTWINEGTPEEKIISSRLVVKSEGKEIYDSAWKELNPEGTEVDLALSPRTCYQWQVHNRLKDGAIISSDVHSFETGKMSEPWSGKWIGVKDRENARHPVFHKHFHVDKSVSSARLYITGLGLFIPFLNDKKITEEKLLPYCNAYDKWLQTFTFELKKDWFLENNEISVMLGNGWYRGRFGFNAQNTSPAYGNEWQLLAEMHIQYEDGSEEIIGTDTDWYITRSDITFSNIYDGEIRDLTLSETEPETPVYASYRHTLTDRLSLSVLKHEEFHPQLLITKKNEYVFDTKQNLAGTFSLHIHEPTGTRIHLQFGEVLQDECFYRDNLRTAKAEYWITCDGKEHIIEPYFTFYGFRYVKVEGIQNLKESDMTVYALYSDITMRGHITTGNSLINQLLSNCEWGMKSNYLDVPTDCPQRDERMGWTGDAQVFSATALYFADTYAFFNKYLYDMHKEQSQNNGAVPHVIPSFHMKDSCSVWGDAVTIIPWNIYQTYGDKRILKDCFAGMQEWVQYIEKVDGKNHGWGRQFHFGDWLALDGDKGPEAVQGATDESFIAYIYYRKSLLITADTAHILKEKELEERYRKKAEKVTDYIMNEFYTPSGRCAVMTMTGQILSLSEHLGDSLTASSILKTLLKRNGSKLATGFVGTPLLCKVLSNFNMSDMAYTLLFNEEYPGWLNEVKLGATTVWERWNSLDQNGKITGIGMNSMNHYSYGSIAEWIYAYATGITPLVPGYRKVRIAPQVDYRMRSLNCALDTASGKYQISWEINDNYHIHMHIEVPYNCEAAVTLPFFSYSENAERKMAFPQGIYDFTYETDRNLYGEITLDSDVSEALKNEDVRKYLESLPLFAQSEFSFGSRSVKEAVLSACGYTESQLEAVRKELHNIQ